MITVIMVPTSSVLYSHYYHDHENLLGLETFPQQHSRKDEWLYQDPRQRYTLCSQQSPQTLQASHVQQQLQRQCDEW